VLLIENLRRDAARHLRILFKPGGRDADFSGTYLNKSAIADIRLEPAADLDIRAEHIGDDMLILRLSQPP